MNANDIAASADTVAIYDGYVDSLSEQGTGFHLSQLMPDGKIYISSLGQVRSLHYIDQPNLKGAACNVKQRGIELPNYFFRGSKPHYPNYRLGPIDGSLCDTLGIDNIPVAKYRYDQDTLNELKVAFTDLSYYEPADWDWDFGDNSTSTDTCPVHTFSVPGSYEVCLTVSNVNLPQGHTYCDTLHLGTVATEEVPFFKTKLFPNPFRETTTLFVYDYLPQDATISFTDISGQVVFRQRVLAGTNVLSLGGLPKGLYFYTIEQQGLTITSGKVVKQ